MSLTKKGETIIEVGLAIAIFGVIALTTIGLMSSGINSAQSALEITMARNEIDAQAEALRFIHNSFLSERELTVDKRQYHYLWKKLTNPINDGGFAKEPINVNSDFNIDNCNDLYDRKKSKNDTTIFSDAAFVLNTRFLVPSDVNNDRIKNFLNQNPGEAISYENLLDQIIISAKDGSPDQNKFTKTPLYPRLIFTNNYDDKDKKNTSQELLEQADKEYLKVEKVEGIWIIAISSESKNQYSQPEFYDFHIRTCWYSPGHKSPTTIGTIIRLYNPEAIEGARNEK